MSNPSRPTIISVISPVQGRVPELKSCLAALQSWRSEGCELILVEDGPTETVREIADFYGARYFYTGQRQGPATARNIGAHHAIGEILVFIDADVVVPSNALTVIRREFAEQAELVALFGSYDDDPGCSDFFSSFKNLFHHHVHQTSKPDAVTFWSGCGAIRKAAFQAIGGFNATLYSEASIEDIELGFRLRQQHQKLRLVKDLQVKHLKKWTLTSLLRADIFQRAVPWSRLILRTGYIPRDLNLVWASRLSAALVAIAVAFAIGLAAALINIVRWPAGEIATALLLIGSTLLFLNRALYALFWRKRGVIFALRAILVHWSYFFYSGATFVFCYAAELMHFPSHSLEENPEFPPEGD